MNATRMVLLALLVLVGCGGGDPEEPECVLHYPSYASGREQAQWCMRCPLNARLPETYC